MRKKGFEIAIEQILQDLFIIMFIAILILMVVGRFFDVKVEVETHHLQRSGINFAQTVMGSPNGLAIVENNNPVKGVLNRSKLPREDNWDDCSEVFPEIYFEEYAFSLLIEEIDNNPDTPKFLRLCGQSENKNVTQFPVAIHNGTDTYPGIISVRVQA